ncbi:MAG: caspase family protein, partial [Pseudomonadota bacterium]
MLAPEPYFATSYALLMGNDAYGNGWPDLKNGVNDAEEMATELERHGFHTVVKRNLRRRELIEALETFFIKTGSDPDARLLVWFSGHGHTVNGEGYLVPSGAPGPDNDVRFRQGAVSVREFGRLMREARSRHVLAILDSCFSGTVFANVRSSLPPPVSQVTNLPVRQFISSGKAGELVSDNGRFRELVIETLSQRRPAADPDQDGYLLGSNLGQFLFEQVSQETGGRQNPQYGKLDDSRFNQGDFVFRTLPLNVALTPSAPPEARPVDARPKTSVHQAVEVAAREAASVHAMVGTPALVGLAGLLMFLWRWRTHGRDLMELAAADGTAQQLADEQKNARRELLRPATYRQRLQAWLNWLSARLGGAHPWGADAYDAMFKLAVAYPIIGVLLVWVITGENTSGIEGLLPEADAISRMAAIGSLAALAVALVGYRSSRGWSRLIWFGAFAFAGAFAGAVAVAV